MEGTVKEMKAAASAAANEAVELLESNDTNEMLKTYADAAIEAAAKAEAAAKKEEVKAAAEEALKALEAAKNCLKAGSVKEDGETSENAIEGENEADSDMSEAGAEEKAETEAENAAQSEENAHSEEMDEAEVKNATEGENEAVKQYVYIGPTITRLGLRENMILYGTLTSVKKHLARAIAEKQTVEKLIFPIEKLTSKNKQKKEKGSYLYQLYESVKK